MGRRSGRVDDVQMFADLVEVINEKNLLKTSDIENNPTAKGTTLALRNRRATATKRNIETIPERRGTNLKAVSHEPR